MRGKLAKRLRKYAMKEDRAKDKNLFYRRLKKACVDVEKKNIIRNAILDNPSL